MRVRFTPRALARAKAAQKQWRETRPAAPDLFEHELAALVFQLETIPHFGTPHPTRQRPWLKRTLLERTEHHVYFERDERKQEIQILMIWHARRGKEPKL